MDSNLIGRAYGLGQDHAEDRHNGTSNLELRSGSQIADALGTPAKLSPSEYCDLLDAYRDGASSFY